MAANFGLSQQSRQSIYSNKAKPFLWSFYYFLFICVVWYQHGTDREEIFGTEVFVTFGGESGI